MNRQLFLAELKLALRDLPAHERDVVLKDYEEYLQEVINSGLSEQEAIERLGDPKEIAEKIKQDKVNVKHEPSTAQNIMVTIFLVMFNLIFVLGPVIGLIGFVFGMFVMSGSFIISPILVLVKMLIGSQHPFELFLSFILAGLGLFLLPLLIKGSQYGFGLLERYVQWNVKHMRGGSL